MEKSFTCIGCPIGCSINVQYDISDGNPINLKVSGNSCPRGKNYAENEIISPVRTLTSTVKTNSSSVRMLPVKTDRPILKSSMKAGMESINTISVKVPVSAGDVIYKNFTGENINLVACRTIKD